MQSGNFIYESETEWETVSEGVRRQIMAFDDQIMLVKVEFQAESIGYLHYHPHRQCTYVASGVFEFEIDGLKKTVKTGDSLYMKPDVKHGVICIESGLLIDVFNPVRKDFLK